MKNLTLDIAHMTRSVVIALALIVALMLGNQALSNAKSTTEQSLRNQAIDSCSQVSSFTVEELNEKTGAKIVSVKPSDEIFKNCVADKGYTLNR